MKGPMLNFAQTDTPIAPGIFERLCGEISSMLLYAKFSSAKGNCLHRVLVKTYLYCLPKGSKI
jgi:hypothetical protein